jgi:putative endonuclease
MKWFVYMLQCSDNTIYTGYTNDVDKRVAKHNKGKGAKYTKGRRPVLLVYYEQHPSKSSAMKREYAIKQLSKDEKIKLMFPIDKEIIR